MRIKRIVMAGVCLVLAMMAGGCSTNYTAVNLSKNVHANTVTATEPDDDFILGQTAFALSLLQNTVKEENLLISPYSVVQALAMTANGADGQTREEMEQLIGKMPVEELNAYLYTQRMHQPEEKECKLMTANSVWFHDDAERLLVNQDFLQTNADYYSADIFQTPFDNTTLTDINSWVNTHTDEMIPTMLEEPIPDEAVMYLINAIVFDAEWKNPYETDDQLRDHNFTAYDGTMKITEMMFSDEYYYLEDAQASGFLKYYEGDRYAFAALLPEEGLSVTAYIAGLTAESLHETLANPSHENVYVGIPKFSYNYEITLNETLAAMGMPSAFDPFSADFSRMADEGGLFISKVLHKTHIDVFEAGTKAAAVTAVEMTDGGMEAPIEEEPKVVCLERPFVYCILDTETSLPVFMGVLMSIPE